MAFPFCLAKDKAGRFCVAFDPLDGEGTYFASCSPSQLSRSYTRNRT
jgi:hypothetical protein